MGFAIERDRFFVVVEGKGYPVFILTLQDKNPRLSVRNITTGNPAHFLIFANPRSKYPPPLYYQFLQYSLEPKSMEVTVYDKSVGYD